MGDVVRLTDARRSHRPIRREEEKIGPATVSLFTGIRIERWDDRDGGPDAAPETRPPSPRRRRRRS